MDINEFFAEVCKGMGWAPTAWRIEVFRFWAQMEGITTGSGYKRLDFHWNPLATTLPGRRSTVDPFGAGPGKWNNANNGQGVGIYADAQAGIEATIATLSDPRWYDGIRDAFARQVGTDQALRDFELTWVGASDLSETKYGDRLIAFMNSTTASKGLLVPALDEAAVRRIAQEEARKVVKAEDIEVDARHREVHGWRLQLEALANEPDADKVGNAVRVLKQEGVL